MGGKKDDLIIIPAYERLPYFCYACGRIGHSFWECDRDSVQTGKLEYGTWLRAVQLTGARNSKPQTSQNTNTYSGKVTFSREHDGDNVESQKKTNKDDVDSNNRLILGEVQGEQRTYTAHEAREIIAQALMKISHDKHDSISSSKQLLQLPHNVEITYTPPTLMNVPISASMKGKEKESVLLKGEYETELPFKNNSMKWKRRARGSPTKSGLVSPGKTKLTGQNRNGNAGDTMEVTSHKKLKMTGTNSKAVQLRRQQ